MSAKEPKDYQIIEFLSDKNDDIMSIDCVPSKWVTYDEKLHSCVTKFMPPPYTKKTNAKLYKYITEKYDAPEDWPCYPVYLRGHAETFTEAQEKISQILKDKKSYAYSTENETHAKEISAHSTKHFQEKSKKGHTNIVEKILYEKETEDTHGSDFENDISNNGNQSVSDKYIKIKQKEIRKSHKKKKHSKAHEHTQHAKLDSNVTFQSTRSKETDNENNHFSKDTLLLHTAIKSLTLEVNFQSEQIMLMRNSMEQYLQVKISSMTVQKFTEKYNVTLKLQNTEEFKNFEQRLIEEEQFRADFKASLKHLTEKSMYKTILAVLKKFLDRHLAMQLTAVRQSKDKYVIKETVFYKTLFDLSCDNCTGENGKPITEKDFNKTLGSIFNNAKDWDGQRNIRRLLANAHQTNNEKDNEAGEEAGVHDAV